MVVFSSYQLYINYSGIVINSNGYERGLTIWLFNIGKITIFSKDAMLGFSCVIGSQTIIGLLVYSAYICLLSGNQTWQWKKKKTKISWWIPSLNQFSSQKSQLAMFDYQSHPLAILENINPLWNARLGRQTKGPKNTYAPWIPHGSSHWIFGRWSHWWLHSFKQKYGRGFKPVTPQLDTIVTGWWFQPTPLKNMKVSWEDNIPNIWKVIKNVPNHQPDVDIMDIMTIFGGCVWMLLGICWGYIRPKLTLQ